MPAQAAVRSRTITARPFRARTWRIPADAGVSADSGKSFIQRRRFAFRSATSVILSLLFLLAGCGTGPYTLRYRLTLDLSIDGASYRGASVVEVFYGTNSTFPNPGSMAYGGAVGQAVVISLGNKGVVVCLMGSSRENSRNDFIAIPEWVYIDSLQSLKPVDRVEALAWERKVPAVSKLTGSAPVPLERLPMIVFFPVRTDPTSMRVVDPQHPADALGDGAKFTGALFEVTQAPLTTGIDDVLPWLKDKASVAIRYAREGPDGVQQPPPILSALDFERTSR